MTITPFPWFQSDRSTLTAPKEVTLIVGGRVVMLNREFLTIDVEELYGEVRQRAACGIEPRQRRFAEMLQRIKPYYPRLVQELVAGSRSAAVLPDEQPGVSRHPVALRPPPLSAAGAVHLRRQ